ncbi:MAG TPA: HlyC/CorC family transporter [Candidatus Avimonoglobus intestinipullorum]|uniref:HlyC/CorC family transporter n=1 Tax=Candidatus Avimonoglobus intestinipullorum TaxID=2840699 RepID=A0A9D1S6R0_9FIRM|nr:HlyC/CorC family transporter [Candidatus Avimonoglobus intestinipullorum]
MNGAIIALVVLIILSAYFSAMETAFTSLNRIRLKNMANSGNKRAALTLDMCENFDKILSTILIGNNIVNILSTSLATSLFVLYFPKNGVAVSTIVMTVIVLIFGEIGPKSIAKEMPEEFALFAAPVLNGLCVIFTPLTVLFSGLKKLIAKILKVKGDRSITEEELLTMVEEARSEGSIGDNEGELIKSAIEFYDLEVEDILIPRVDVIAVDSAGSPEEIDHIFYETRFSRLPVYKETIDNVIGIINQKDFQYQVIGKGEPLEHVIKPALYVLEHMQISDLMRLLQQKKSHMAVVTDEYGGTLGIVTLEDIIEELVGEIWDEHDEVVEEFTEISPLCYRVSCNANLDKMLELFDLEEEAQSSTVGGWVMEELGRIPKEGDRFRFRNLSVTVTKVEDRRALEVIAAALEPGELEE